MKYRVMLEKTMLGRFIVEAEDEDYAVCLAKAEAKKHPEEFEEDAFEDYYLCEQWELHEDGNDIQIY